MTRKPEAPTPFAKARAPPWPQLLLSNPETPPPPIRAPPTRPRPHRPHRPHRPRSNRPRAQSRKRDSTDARGKTPDARPSRPPPFRPPQCHSPAGRQDKGRGRHQPGLGLRGRAPNYISQRAARALPVVSVLASPPPGAVAPAFGVRARLRGPPPALASPARPKTLPRRIPLSDGRTKATPAFDRDCACAGGAELQLPEARARRPWILPQPSGRGGSSSSFDDRAYGVVASVQCPRAVPWAPRPSPPRSDSGNWPGTSVDRVVGGQGGR